MAGGRIVEVFEGTNLGQFLKFARVADTGGEAKMLVEAGDVTVNGLPERRRGHTLHDGDTVETAGQVLVVRIAPRKGRA